MRSKLALGFLTVWTMSCTDAPGDGEETAGETTTYGDGGGDSGDGDGDGDSGDGDGDGDSGDGDGDGDGDPSCPPADPDAYFSYEPFEFGGDPWDVELEWICTVTEVDVSDGLYLLLDCPDADMPITIDISTMPSFSPPVFVDDIVQVHYVSEGPWWFNVYLRLDVEGPGHLLTLIDGDSLLPPDNFTFEPGFDLQSVSGLCTPTPDACGDAERLALGFTVDGEAVELFDSSHAIVGGEPGTDVWVSTATHLHDVQCTDTPDEWFRVLIATRAPSP